MEDLLKTTTTFVQTTGLTVSGRTMLERRRRTRRFIRVECSLGGWHVDADGKLATCVTFVNEALAQVH